MLLGKRQRTLVVGAHQVGLSGDATPFSGSSLADIREACREGAEADLRAGGLRVVISDRWLVWTTLPWTEELLNSRKVVDQYALHAQIASGRETTDFAYAAELGAFGAPSMLAALPGKLHAEIGELAGACKLTVTSIRPLSMACWEQRRASIKDTRYAFASVDRGSIAVLFIERGRPTHIVAQRYQAAEPVALSVIWRRVRLREPALARFEKLYVDYHSTTSIEPGDDAGIVRFAPRETILIPDNHRREFDFVARSAPTRTWRMALAAVGLICLVVSGIETWGDASHRAEMGARLESLQLVPARGPTLSKSESRQRKTQIRAVNQAVRSLNVPVGALLQAVQPPGDLRVALLALDLSDPRDITGASLVKLSAESRTSADMTGYVEFLSQTGMFASVYLVRHEITGNGAQRAYRFSIEALWPQ